MNPKDIHLIFIGYNRVSSLGLQLDIIRNNWPNGKDFWITVVYTGSCEWLSPGVFGENNFIKLDENRGYGLGALDSINAGFDFALHHNRNIVILSNFDSGFLTQEGMEIAINEFVESGKSFCAGADIHGIPVTDGIVLWQQEIEKIFPIRAEVHFSRLTDSYLQQEYKDTLLGFMNMEEIFYNAVLKADLQDKWHKMDRGELPRLRFSNRNTFWHIHEPEDLRNLCLQFNIVHGVRVQRLLSFKDLSYFNANVAENPNVVTS